MAKVSLRIYSREIESLVDSGQLDEAIAHCRHILNIYPKHLETYRMLGKAYLEAKRYEETTDIFERVLMAVPDDFVAHVGMSIIRDEQKDMDAAIWHMQRAFEVQPANSAIQAELQRLYGRRDGVEPPKIRLTRGALAHMYVQGELYPQAISEIKNVLEEDSDRQDMQVLLARAYFHAGQKSESAEICSQLLRRYPYCFDANRVMVELLPQTERGESVQVYRNRVNELDPYAAFVSGSILHTEEVSDAAVSLERLEWDGQSVDVQPEWGESRGIGKSAATYGDAEPDWLKAGLTPETPTASTPGDELASEVGGISAPSEDGESEIPDFLREAGWGEDTGAFQEGASSMDISDDSTVEPAIAEGELPDWVKAMAPAGADIGDATPQAEAEEDLTQDDVPDWLQGLGDVQSTPSEQEPADADTPDWLEPMQQTDDAAVSSQEQPQEQAMIEPDNDDDLPDWLKAAQAEEEGADPQEISQEPVQESSAIGDESLSDWQIGDEAPAGPVDFDTTDTGKLGTSAEEQDDAVAWLESLASKHGAKPEELVTDPESRHEEAPDWVQKAQSLQDQGQVEASAAPQEQPPMAEEPSQPVEQAAPSDAPVSVDDLGASAEEQDDAVAWLESLASKHGAKSEELVTDPASRHEEAPDWVQKAQSLQDQGQGEASAPQEQPPVAEEPAQPVEQAAPSDAPVSVDDLGTSAEEQDDAVAWLEGLASKHGAKPEELVTDPKARHETAPEWVQKATEAGADNAIGERPTAPPPEESAEDEPDWMKQAKEVGESLYDELEEAQTKEALPAADTDETGMWLRDLGQEGGFTEEQDEQPAAEFDVPDWLTELDSESTQPGAVPETESVPELESAPEAGATPEPAGEAEPEPPDWLQSMEAEVSGTEETPVSSEDASLPDWLSDIDESSAETESEPAILLEDEATSEQEFAGKIDINTATIEQLAVLPGIGDLLAQNIVAQRETFGEFSNVDELSSIAGIGPSTIDELRGRVEFGETKPEDEDASVTDWLKNVEAESPVGETAAKRAASDDLPSWLAGLDDDTEQPQPVTDSDDDLPSWLRADAEQETTQAEPTAPTDWKPVDEAPSHQEEPPVPAPEPEVEETPVQAAPPPAPEPKVEEAPVQTPPPPAPEPKPEPAPEREPYREPVTRSRSGMTGMLSAAQDPALTEAQNELTRSNIPAAMENYGKLIKKGKMLDEIIFDLREAMYRYPVEVAILQTLGDAYMRANRLQDALDAYTKAEELLR